ncbi:MAG TPA: glycosyltransferase family 4 protein, partial [Solirubrobacteraceae bacterium]|nr:glycosyltransferase family 4 protein [Solirubrobacteraceae bacterium]
ARRLGGPPVVAHVRDWVPPGRAAALTLRVVAQGAALTVANSAFSAGQLPAGVGEVLVVHNPVDLRRFDRAAHDRAAARAALGLEPDDEVLAVVAQLTPWKGQQDAIEALRLVRRERPRAKLLIAGSAKFTAASTRFDNVAYARELERAAAAPDLAGAVRLLGERDDVEAVLAAVDVLLVPSWREAFGRIAAEALAMEVPVVATNVGGPAETVRDGVDGVLLPPRRPGRWARAIAELLADPERRVAMGRAGAERVRGELGARAHAERIRAAYGAVLARAANSGNAPKTPPSAASRK